MAEVLIPLVGRLFREHGVITAIYGRSLVNKSTKKILKLHRVARHVDGQSLPINQTLAIAETLARLRLSPATIDIAELNRLRQSTFATPWEDSLRDQLASIIDPGEQPTTTDVVLYGFGRIGRLLARLMIENHGAPNGLRLRAIVVRQGAADDLVKRASLLRRDTVHGAFDGSITVDPDTKHHHCHRHPHPRHQRQRSFHRRLHGLRHPARPAGRQHGPLARRRRTCAAAGLPRHRQRSCSPLLAKAT